MACVKKLKTERGGGKLPGTESGPKGHEDDRGAEGWSLRGREPKPGPEDPGQSGQGVPGNGRLDAGRKEEGEPGEGRKAAAANEWRYRSKDVARPEATDDGG